MKMKMALYAAAAALLSASAFAGAGGIVVKGVAKTWDEVAKAALEISGRAPAGEALAEASKTIRAAAEKYGDDVAEASMRGGVEVAEQTAKTGGRFLDVVRRASKSSPEALRALARQADDAIRLTEKYGDEVLALSEKTPGAFARAIAAVEKSGVADAQAAVKAVAGLPAEDVTRVVGALERNPGVAREFLGAVERGGRLFVDKVFELNGRQILAGGLSVAAVAAAVRATAPFAAEGRAVDAQTGMAAEAMGSLSDEDRKGFFDSWSDATSRIRSTLATSAGRATVIAAAVLSALAGAALLLRIWLKSKKDLGDGNTGKET